MNDKLLCDWVRTTKRFVKDHPEILISKADKGNVTVAQNKFEYISKMESMLSDKNTYKLITKDPTKKLTGELRNLLGRWKGKGVIDDLTYRRLRTTDGVIPRAYGVTKIHKQNHPLRVIVSSVNSPFYNLASFLHGIIADSLPETPSHIKNSYDLIKKLKNVKLESDSVLVSLDVVSLFTNIPIDLASDSVVVRWDAISKKTKILLDEFLIAFRMVLNSTIFIFNKKIYKQIFGTFMGSRLSLVVAKKNIFFYLFLLVFFMTYRNTKAHL